MPADDADIVAVALETMGAVAASAVRAATSREGLMLLTDVKRRAARSRTLPSVEGEPPRLQTGDYNRSINIHLSEAATHIVASVGTNAVQGARLEFGMNAPGKRTLAHPHFGPALDAAAPKFVAAIEAAVAAGQK